MPRNTSHTYLHHSVFGLLLNHGFRTHHTPTSEQSFTAGQRLLSMGDTLLLRSCAHNTGNSSALGHSVCTFISHCIRDPVDSRTPHPHHVRASVTQGGSEGGTSSSSSCVLACQLRSCPPTDRHLTRLTTLQCTKASIAHRPSILPPRDLFLRTCCQVGSEGGKLSKSTHIDVG